MSDLKKQSIYIAFGSDPDNKLFPKCQMLCWHENRQRAGDVGKEIADRKGIDFEGVSTFVNNADYEAKSSFPVEHFLNQDEH